MTRPASYNRVWAEDATSDQMGGETTTADQGVIEQGWVGSASAEPPTARMQNYWQIRVDMGLQEIEQQGFLSWRSDVPYKKASLVYYAGYLFQANSANTNITPQGASDNNIWSFIQPGNWPTTPDSFTGTLPIAKGGTGATNQSDALSNLGGAPIASPVLTGDPKAPTPATGDSDTSIATTAFVQAAMAVYGVGPTSKQVTDANAVPGSGIYFASGSASNLPVAAFGTLIHDQATTNVASQLFIATTANQLWTRTQTAATTWTAWAQYAGIASPAFTGNPTAPTATVGDNDTSIATTAFVQAAMAVYGIGSGSSTQVTDANLALVGGFSRMASAGLNKPVTGGGTLLVMPSFSNNITQMFVDATASANVFTRISTDTGVTWGAWSQQVGMTLAGINSTIKSLTGLTDPLAVPTPVLAGQAAQAGRVGSAGGLSFRNIIHNANFNVNQRGYVSGTATTIANQLTLDRWKVQTLGQSVAFSASANGSSIVAPSGGFAQVIEAKDILGGTYCASWTGSGTITVNGSGVAKGASFTLPANTNATVVLVGAVSQFQVEIGTIATSFEVRPYAVELSICQRYAYVLGGGSAQVVAWGFMATATAGGNFMVSTPVPLRASPTMSDIGTGSAIQILSTTTSAASVPTSLLAQGSIVSFNASSASSNTVGAIAGYFIGATSRVLLSADL